MRLNSLASWKLLRSRTTNAKTNVTTSTARSVYIEAGWALHDTTCTSAPPARTFTAFIYADHSYSPIVALRPRTSWRSNPLLSDSRDYAPYGTTNGYTQDGNTRRPSLPSSERG
ncbi:hypothetical protein GQ600_26572 [Phytophthora cactorum]|nr:hypothetical protein GQ600_26572 [Phytophthora cactorum]